MAKEIPDWRRKAWRINLYICPDCKMGFTTVDLTEGTTPHSLRCINRMDGCAGRAMSQGYPHERPIPNHVPEPVYEFFMPTLVEMEELKIKNRSVYDHCAAGGLAIRERNVSHEPAKLKHLLHRVGQIVGQHESSGHILEVVEEDDNFIIEGLAKGFYYYMEKATHVVGPFNSIPEAVVARNKHYKI